jgi:hypothetical protein
MAAQKNLILMPANRLDAFAATGVLADVLRAEPGVVNEIICHETMVPFFQDAPGQMRFVTYSDDYGPGLAVMMQALGRRWNRVISLTQQKLPFLVWARHRHVFTYTPESYALPSLLAPQRAAAPHIWMPDKLHLALPETLAPDTPLVVFTTGENQRADWSYRHYAELAWRLAESVPELANAHIVVSAQQGCPLAGALMANLPAGQITRLDDLSFAKQAGLMRRAHLVIGSDRLAARVAPYAGARLVLRLDRTETQAPGRPYGLYTGHDAAQVAQYIHKSLAQNPARAATSMAANAMTGAISKTDMQALAAQVDRINRDE